MSNPDLVQLFFVHIQKCAGMSMLDALERSLPVGRIYQNTSMIQNWWNNRPEFLSLSTHNFLRVVYGHWLQEEMLKFTRAPIILATCIRDPLERLKSQYRFDYSRAADRAVNYVLPGNYLESNDNLICRSLIRAFPSFIGDSDVLHEQAINILSMFDYVFDVSDMQAAVDSIFRDMNLEPVAVPRINASDDNSVDIAMDDDALSIYIEEDIKLYKYFKAGCLYSAGSQARNPFFRKCNRDALDSFRQNEVKLDSIVEYMTECVAAELIYGRVPKYELERLSWQRKYIGSLYDKLKDWKVVS